MDIVSLFSLKEFLYINEIYINRINYISYSLLYNTCRFSQLFDLDISLRQIFCRISLAKRKDKQVLDVFKRFKFNVVVFFLTRCSFKRIYLQKLKKNLKIVLFLYSPGLARKARKARKHKVFGVLYWHLRKNLLQNLIINYNSYYD